MTSYTYTTGIPNPTDTPANDVSDMQTNTNSINSIWETDHVGFNSTGPTMTGTGGMHLQCQFCGSNVPSNPPSFPTLFVNTQDGNSHTLPNSIAQLFFYSGSSTVGSSQYYVGTAGSTFTLGGIIFKWGTVSASNNTTVTFVNAFPNNCFGVFVSGGLTTGTQPTININPVSVSVSGFVYKITGTTPVTCYYLAIGN